jgi:predicted regulator of Ras-like GTPase activity (Roadblock/LC7/MglB family)
VFDNGTSENLDGIIGSGIGLNLSMNMNILIADMNNSRVIEIADYGWYWQYGSNSTSGYGLNQLSYPTFAVNVNIDRFLITDQGNHRVIEVGRNGEFYWQYGSNTSFGNGTNQLYNATSAVPMASGNILIADTGNNRVIEVDRNKNIVWNYNISLANVTYAEELSNGSILITDKDNNRVIEVNKLKQIYWFYGSGKVGFKNNQLYSPTHATRLSNGNTLISDTLNQRVIEGTPGKTILWQYGKNKVSGYIANRLNIPTCAYRLTNGDNFISDKSNHRVLVVDSDKNWINQYGINATSGVTDNYLNSPHSATPIPKMELSGYYISEVLDGGKLINWTFINWEDTIPPNTNIKLYTRSGNTPSPGLGGWSDWSSAYLLSSGENITSPINRYIQYKADFYTGNIITTPILKRIYITGHSFELTGDLTTEFFQPIGLLGWETFNWVGNLNGQNLQIYYSTNSSLPWQPIGSGDLTSVLIDTGKIRFRFRFTTTNTSISPILDNFSLIYSCLDDLANIEIAPNPMDVVVGEDFNFTAVGFDTYDREMLVEPIWSTTVGTISDGTLTAQTTVGTGFVNATQSSITGSAVVNIIAGPLVSIEVSPSDVEVIASELQFFNAIGYDRFKNEIMIDPNWSANIGLMTDNILTAQNFAGNGWVKAKVGNITGIANVTVKLNESIHHPPTFQSRVPDQLKPEDSDPWTITLTSYEFDLEDSGDKLLWYITNVNTDLCQVTGSYSNDDVLKFIPKANAYGTNEATLWLKDSDNMTASQVFWINITPVNDKPVIKDIPDIMVHYDESYIFDYSNYISDVETPQNQLMLSIQEPAGQSYTSVKGLNVTFNYPKSTLGETYTLKLMVSDGTATVEEVFKVAVSDNHGPRLIKNIPEITLKEGETKYFIFDLDEYFIDPDGDILTYSHSADNVLVNRHENNSISVSSSGAWSGTDTITFRAMDPFGAMVEAFVRVNVIGINDPPSISPLPDLYIHYEYEYEFDLTQYIIDPDNDKSELSLWTTDSEHITFSELDNTLMVLLYPDYFLGQTILINLFVSDGIDIASREFLVHITDNFPPVVTHEMTDIYFDEDTILTNALNLTDYFSDQDDNSLDFSYLLLDDQNISIRINDNYTVDVASAQDWFGSSSVVFKAQDQKRAFVENEILIVVIPVNDPPKIDLIPIQRGKVDERWIMDLTPYLSDVDNDITELEIEIGPGYAHIVNLTSKQLIFNSKTPVNVEIDVTVSDGDIKTQTTIHLIITGRKTDDSSYWIWILLIIIVLITLVSIGIAANKRRGNFVIKDVFLIHKDGLLIKYVGTSLKQDLDEDIVSGMLTGIQSFITHSFSTQSKEKDLDWGIKQLKMEDRELMIERGDNIFLTVIYDGTPGQRLPKLLSELVTKIEKKYGDALEEWGGRESSVEGIEKIVEPFLKSK